MSHSPSEPRRYEQPATPSRFSTRQFCSPRVVGSARIARWAMLVFRSLRNAVRSSPDPDMRGWKGGGVSGDMELNDRFDKLYDGHRVALNAYCRRRVARDVVDDVMAEVFLSAWRRIDQIPGGAELPWLYGVARNVIANYRRSDTRRSRLGLRLVGERREPSGDASNVMADESLVLVALERLSEGDQELLRLRAWENLSSAEMGVVLGISASAVDMRLLRARRRLGGCLKRVASKDRAPGRRVAEEGLS